MTTSGRFELPGIWLDQVVLDDLDGAAHFLRIINRWPDSGHVDVESGLDPAITFDLALDAAAGGITTFGIYVAVDGGPETLVFDGVTPAPGWTVGVVGVSGTALRFKVTPPSPFTSLQVVTVRVTASTNLPQSLDTSWSFTIEDLTAPQLVDVSPTGKDTLAVAFDEPMDQTTALVAANYTITHLTVPAADVVVASVAIDTTNSVILTLDVEMTPGATYRLQVDNVEDLPGNPILAPFNVLDFVGYQPQLPDGRSWELWRMIPRKNRDEDPGDLLKFILCLQEVTDLLLCQIDTWTNVLDPDLAPEIFVDAILQDLGNPFNFDLEEADKRRLVRILVPIYQQKGTGVGIVNAVRFFLGIEVTINAFSAEGWDLGIDELGDSVTEGTAILGPGTSFARFSFEIVADEALTQDQRDQITAIANYMKPAHTHLIQIVEPAIPTVIDHLELGLSELGTEWFLH